MGQVLNEYAQCLFVFFDFATAEEFGVEECARDRRETEQAVPARLQQLQLDLVWLDSLLQEGDDVHRHPLQDERPLVAQNELLQFWLNEFRDGLLFRFLLDWTVFLLFPVDGQIPHQLLFFQFELLLLIEEGTRSLHPWRLLLGVIAQD